MELQLQLRVQAKMLEKEAAREEKTADKERKKAKVALSKGQRDFATLYAQNAVKAQQHALFLQQNAAKVSSMVADLRIAEVQAKQAKTLESVVKDLEKSVGSMDLEKIAAATLKYDQLKGKTSTVQQIVAPEIEVEAEGLDLLNILQDEIVAEDEIGFEIPITGTTEKPLPGQKIAGGTTG